jgi:hypothetical protein
MARMGDGFLSSFGSANDENGPSAGGAGTVLSGCCANGDLAVENLVCEAFPSTVTHLGYGSRLSPSAIALAGSRDSFPAAAGAGDARRPHRIKFNLMGGGELRTYISFARINRHVNRVFEGISA